LSEVSASRRSRRLVYGSIVVIGLVAWAATFLAPGSRFWDDWPLANGDTLRLTREIGLPWTGYIDLALLALGQWSFKVLAVAAGIVVGMATFAISGRGLALTVWERWLLSALVVALPLYAPRTLAIVGTYSWSLALFFVAWYLLVRKAPGSGGRLGCVVAAVLFFVSYTTASLLPFTALPVLHVAYLTLRGTTAFWRDLLRLIGRYWYVLAAPVLFWIVRSIFFRPSGLYADYNEFILTGKSPTAHTSVKLLAVLFCVFVVLVAWRFIPWPRAAWLRELLTLGALSVATAAVAYFVYVNRGVSAPQALALVGVISLCALLLLGTAVFRAIFGRRRAPLPRAREVTPILALGLIAVLVGVLPYLLVGKVPTFANWDARNQLLMPLGVATVIVATVRAVAAISRPLVVRAISVALITGFAFLSLYVSLTLVADWKKQEQIIHALASAQLVRDGSTIVFRDRSANLNYDGRTYSFYEYDGWMITAFGDESRLGIDGARASVRSFVDSHYYDDLRNLASRYGFGDYTGPTHGNTSAVLVQILPVKGASVWTLLLNQPSVRLEVTPIKNLASLT
jgi:hypothetical protein